MTHVHTERRRRGKNDRLASQPQTGRRRETRHGDVPDGATQETRRFARTLAQAPATRGVKLNEGGRTNDASERDNPPDAVEGLPAPSYRGTGKNAAEPDSP